MLPIRHRRNNNETASDAMFTLKKPSANLKINKPSNTDLKSMPKTYPKNQPKKTKLKPKNKAEPKPVSITSSKIYWVTLTAVMLVFGSVYGYMMNVALAAIVLLLVCVVSMIGFAYYLRFKPSTLKRTSRATFIFVGACVGGFCIWVAIVLLLSVAGFWPQIASSMSERFFATASLVICLIAGGFIGDLVGDNKERISTFLHGRFGG